MPCPTPDVQYFKTIPGLLHIGQLLCVIIGLICAATSPLGFAMALFIFVGIIAIIITGILFVLNAYNKMEAFNNNPRIIFGEFIYLAGAAALFLINAIIAASFSMFLGALGATAAFAFFATVFYGLDAFLKHKKRKEKLSSDAGNNTAPPKI